jgi:hypothetical protein
MVTIGDDRFSRIVTTQAVAFKSVVYEVTMVTMFLSL